MPLFDSPHLQAQVEKVLSDNGPASAVPVLPAGLSAVVVLSHKLDTRELPVHLRRELEKYRRLEGVFTLLQVDFGVERIAGER